MRDNSYILPVTSVLFYKNEYKSFKIGALFIEHFEDKTLIDLDK